MKLVIAKTTFFTPSGRVTRGESYPAGHTLVKQYPDSFVTPDEWAAGNLAYGVAIPEPAPIEAATAAPGEKRATRKPIKK